MSWRNFRVNVHVSPHQEIDRLLWCRFVFSRTKQEIFKEPGWNLNLNLAQIAHGFTIKLSGTNPPSVIFPARLALARQPVWSALVPPKRCAALNLRTVSAEFQVRWYGLELSLLYLASFHILTVALETLVSVSGVPTLKRYTATHPALRPEFPRSLVPVERG